MGETHERVRQGVNADPVPIRHAATVMLVRDVADTPSVLMGQRGRSAAFMPDKFVFPGGAVDPADQGLDVALNPVCSQRLAQHSTCPPETLAATAIRELWEETGQRLSHPGAWPEAPEPWQGFASEGLPDASSLRFFFRAITPPGRPRRFDARFFLADAGALSSDPDVFSPAEAELSHLRWVPLPEIRDLNLPFITRIVLAELAKHLPRTDAPDRVPFVRNDDLERDVVWL